MGGPRWSCAYCRKDALLYAEILMLLEVSRADFVVVVHRSSGAMLISGVHCADVQSHHAVVVDWIVLSRLMGRGRTMLK